MNNKIKEWLSKGVDKECRDNVFIPKHGVTKQVASNYWKKRGSFNGQLFDRIMEIKLAK